jgi:NAD(P)-dependent dehydrogenase (short-subunit alcohol dehydrogenase family)
MTTLSGKTTLVTGASRGMGRASALALAAAGAQVPTAKASEFGNTIRAKQKHADAVS